MARIVRFYKTGGPEVLQIQNVEVPPPGKGEVQITIKALGLNRAESMFRSGQYLEDPKLPARPVWWPRPNCDPRLDGKVRLYRVGLTYSSSFETDEASRAPAFAI